MSDANAIYLLLLAAVETVTRLVSPFSQRGPNLYME